ncbi:MAG: hypothetical protein K0S04_665 [Herbinix sp.]|nr:hypothetical protein [Herbinix sp.]
MLNSILTTTLSMENFLICTIASLVLGAVLALVHGRFNNSSKGFVMTMALLPAVVQIVILLVNGNLGTGVAVMGAFSLIRFRSVPGSAKEISSLFMAMAVGLATGTGYVGVAVLFVIIVGGASVLFNVTSFGETRTREKELKITIPEGMDYMEIFNDIFDEYTKKTELIRVKTSNMGSLYKLHYQILIKDPVKEKAMIDELRCRNGNLEISCGRVSSMAEEL